jgi:hypothetical protein
VQLISSATIVISLPLLSPGKNGVKTLAQSYRSFVSALPIPPLSGRLPVGVAAGRRILFFRREGATRNTSFDTKSKQLSYPCPSVRARRLIALYSGTGG